MGKEMRVVILFVMAFFFIIAVATQVKASGHLTIADIFADSTDADFDDLEQVVYWESVRAGAPIETSMAVVEVVANRCLDKHPEFPKTIKETIKQRKQFSTVKHFYTHRFTEYECEEVCDAISEVVNGEEVLGNDEFVYFDYKICPWGRDWTWVGLTDENGKPIKGKGMYFAKK